MKYPIDINAAIAECRALYPENVVVEPILRAVLPMVNEAYEQGCSEAASTKSESEPIVDEAEFLSTIANTQSLVESIDDLVNMATRDHLGDSSAVLICCKDGAAKDWMLNHYDSTADTVRAASRISYMLCNMMDDLYEMAEKLFHKNAAGN